MSHCTPANITAIQKIQIQLHFIIQTFLSQDRNGGNNFTRVRAVSSLQLARERASGNQPSIARAPVRIAPTVRAVTEGLRGLAGAPAVNVTGNNLNPKRPCHCLYFFAMF